MGRCGETHEVCAEVETGEHAAGVLRAGGRGKGNPKP